MSPRRANALVAVSLIVLLGVVSFTAPRWSLWLRRPLPAADLATGSAGEAAPSRQAEPAKEPDRKISVKLFFPAGDRQVIHVPNGRGEELRIHLASHGIRSLVSPAAETPYERLEVEADVDPQSLQTIVDLWER